MKYKSSTLSVEGEGFNFKLENDIPVKHSSIDTSVMLDKLSSIPREFEM